MSGEALHNISGIQNRGHTAPGILHLFAAALLCRPLDPLAPDVDALVRSADAEASRMAEGGRVDTSKRDAAAFRLVYRALRDRAARIRPGEIVSEPRWMRAVSALSWLRHRQRALLILDAMTSLTVAEIADIARVSPHEAKQIISSAVQSVARALGGPTDVRRDLGLAAKHLLSPDEVVRAKASSSGKLPRSVVRLLLATPQARVPQPPVFDPEMTPVDSLLALAETEPSDITFVSPTPPKPPVPIPVLAQSRWVVPRGAVVATAALLLVIAALLPSVSRAVRPSIRPSSPSVQGVTLQARAPVTHHVVVAPSIKVHRGDTLWAIAGRTLHDPLRWREIWRLNRGKPMRTGDRFTDPNLIRPGWVLQIPR
jgi:LysM domain